MTIPFFVRLRARSGPGRSARRGGVRALRPRALTLAIAGLAAAVAAALTVEAGAARRPARQDAAPQRIISLIPAVTEMLFGIGAGPQVVAVGSFDSYPPEVESLPRVGALIDPNIEHILSLRPDLVALYGSQTDAIEQMRRAGIETFSYRHGGVADVGATMRALGRVTGRDAGAEAAVQQLEAGLAAVRERVRGRDRPRVLLVLERETDTIRSVYANGGVGFLHDVIEIAGGENVFAGIAREAVQPSTERILAAAPDVIVETRVAGLVTAAGAARQQRAWRPLASVPAVRNGRLHLLAGAELVVPGPRLPLGAERLARLLHPQAFD